MYVEERGIRRVVDHCAVRACRRFQSVGRASVRVKGARSKNRWWCGRSARLAGKDRKTRAGVLLEKRGAG